MKKVFRNIHLWLSVPFGLIITLICFSGAMLVFENEVMELCHRDLYYVRKVKARTIPMDELMAKVSGILPDSVSITGISISSDPERTYQVSLSKPHRASLSVDQYTGEVKGRSGRTPFFLAMFKLHRWLLDSMKPDGGIFVGKVVVGTSTLMFVFVLISGIVIWWPRTKRVLKNSLKITVGKGWRRFWYDLHVVGGMYTLVLLLAMAITGLTWSFSWYRTGFYKVLGVELSKQPHSKNKENSRVNSVYGHTEGQRLTLYANWEKVYDKLKTHNPDYKQITFSKGTATVFFNRLGNQRAADRYTFNPHNGEIIGTIFYEDTDKVSKIRGWIYSVHVGNWGGLFTRILTFIAALIGCTLPLTGYYLWLRRLRQRRGKMLYKRTGTEQ